jgi:hypothetical protein
MSAKKNPQRRMSCSCGSHFDVPLDVYMANGGHMGDLYAEPFRKWLAHHGSGGHVKSLAIVEGPPKDKVN